METHKLKIKQLLFLCLMALVIASCGSSDSETAEEPPAPEATDNSGGEEPESEEETEEDPITLNCNKDPETSNIGVGANAKAVFVLSETLNVNGKIQSSCGAFLLENKSSFLASGLRDFTQNVPIMCSGSTLKIEFTSDSDAYSAACTWEVD